MRYVRAKANGDTYIYFHSGPLPEEIEQEIVCLAPQDVLPGEQSFLTIVDDPKELFGKRSFYSDPEALEIDRERRIAKEKNDRTSLTQARLSRQEGATTRLRNANINDPIVNDILIYLGIKEE